MVLPLVIVRPGLLLVVVLRPAGKGAGAGMACTAAMTATTAAAENILPNIVRCDVRTRRRCEMSVRLILQGRFSGYLYLLCLIVE